MLFRSPSNTGRQPPARPLCSLSGPKALAATRPPTQPPPAASVTEGPPAPVSQRLAQLAEGPRLSSNHLLRSSQRCLPGDSQAQPPSGAAWRSWGSRQDLTTSEQPQPIPSSQPRGKPLPTQPQPRSRGFLSLLCWRSVKHSAPRSGSAVPPGQGPPCTLETSAPCFKPQHGH